MQKTLKSIFASILLVVLFSFVSVAEANHSWAGYHWARTSNPFTLKLGDNVTSNWDSFVSTASVKWSLSSVLDTIIVPGQSNAKTCKPTLGRVEICNSKYGNNGWLGIASIWATGTHITQGTVKLNDTYFATAKYNTVAWKNLVVCQEIAHTFGLDHQDENFTNANLGTCMDYTNDSTTNQFPNQHDYDQLITIYSHLDTVTTISQSTPGSIGSDVGMLKSDWGKAIKKDKEGRDSVFEKDLGHGNKILTHVYWAE